MRKYTDEQLSRIVSEHEAGVLTRADVRMGAVAVNGFQWSHYEPAWSTDLFAKVLQTAGVA